MTTVDRARAARVQTRLAGPADRAAWDAFVAAHPAGDQLQAWGWGEVAASWGERPVRVLVTGGDAIVGLAQVLVRRAPFGRTVFYVPHGPLWLDDVPTAATALDNGSAAGSTTTPGVTGTHDADPLGNMRTLGDGAGASVLGLLLKAIREAGRAERGIVAKLDPRAIRPDDEHGLVETLTACGLRRARADLQARTTRILDLRQPHERLVATFEKDTRNLVRRAAREGVVADVIRDADPAAYGEFAALLAATGTRAGFRVRGEKALGLIAAEFAPSGGAFLVLARLEGRAIAGCLALAAGRRAFYLYAASLRDPALRHANGAYAALAVLCDALAGAGVESLDLWGVAEADDATADASWAGFSLFKRGFGGERLRHPGTFDLVLSPAWYAVRDLRERVGRAGGH